MKKHSLAKILIIMLVLLVIVSCIIKGREGYQYLAVGDIMINYFQSFYYFFDTVLFILIVGGFYGLLEHVKAYTNMQEKLANKFKNNKKALFLITIIFVLLSSLTGLNILLLIFIPFVISLILKMGYNKIVALLATVGSIVIGLMGGIFITLKDPYYGSSTTFAEMVGLENKFINVIPNIILLVVGAVLLILCINKIIKQDKEETKEFVKKENEEEKEIKEEVVTKAKEETKKKSITKIDEKNNSKPETNKKNENKSNNKKNSKKNLSAAKADNKLVIKKDYKNRIWPLIVVFSLLLVLLVLGYMPWNSLFGITVFDDFHKWLTELSIKEYAIFNSLISSSITAFGTWQSLGNYMMGMILILIFSIIIKFIYKIKINDMFDYFIDGMKKMLPAALVTMLAYTILICAYNNGFIETIITSASDKFGDNIMVNALISMFGSITNVDLYYTTAGVFTPIVSALSENANLQVFAVLFQSLYGLIQLIGPTSILLIICLTYTDVSYKDWFKNTWKLVLEIFIIIFIAILVISMI